MNRVLGYMPGPDLAAAMHQMAAGIGTLDDMRAQYDRNPDSLYLAMDIADKFQERGDDSMATVYRRMVIERDPDNRSGLASTAALQIARRIYKADETRWEEAIIAFRDVVANYPGTEAAEVAEWYVPYIREQQGRIEEAVELYRQYVEHYDGSDRVPWVVEKIAELTAEGP